MIEFNPNSPQHLSALLFGATLQSEESEPVLNEDGNFYLYKSGEKQGQIKYQKVMKEVRFEGLGLKPLKEWKTKKAGVYQVGESTLELIAQQPGIAADICKLILEIRGLKKQISTYYDSTLDFIDENGFVHAQFSHCATGTARLGCSKPNIQNQPDQVSSKVKQHFQTRYGTKGALISADYSQLEIIVQAQLSGDKQFIQDVIDGVDFHVKRLALQEGLEYSEVKQKVDSEDAWKNKRKQVKGFSFARAYGAGVAKIASQTGMEEDAITDLIAAEALEYPRLTMWCEWNKEQVHKQGYYTGFTGRRYNFKKYPPKFHWQKQDSYSPTEIKNYIIQGSATADIVLIMLGKFWREKALHNRDKYVIINTIHDSVMLDCRKEFVDQANKDLKTLERVQLMCYNYFNYDWIVPIKVDIALGTSWYDL